MQNIIALNRKDARKVYVAINIFREFELFWIKLSVTAARSVEESYMF